MASRLQDVIQRGTSLAKPLATDVAPGTLYFSTDTVVLERSDGASWETYSGAGGGSTNSNVNGALLGLILDGQDGNEGMDGIPGPPGPRGATGAAGTGDVVGPAASVASEIALYDGITGKLIKRATGTGFVRALSGVAVVTKLRRTIGLIIGDGTTTIATGVQGFVSVPITCTIVAVRLLSSDAAATSGSIVVDIWKDTYVNYPPTVADTITAAAKPTISAAIKSEDTTLTGWTVAITAGDVLGFKVDSITSLKRVNVELSVDE